MVDSWEELKIKKKKKIPRLILLFFILLISSIFVINNSDFFTKKRKTETKNVDLNQNRKNDNSSSITASGDNENSENSNIPGNQVVDSVSSLNGHKEKEIRDDDMSRKSVELHGIKCLLADRDSLTIQISLKLLFEEEKIKAEILLKRDVLINIIKKIIRKKKLSDIVINKLRIECKSEFNKLLKKGKIDDVEFIDFRPLNTTF